MKLRHLFLGLAFLYGISCSFAQEDKPIEELWMQCICQGYENQGEAIKSLFKEFKAQLLADGLLKDKTESSVKELITAMAEGDIQRSESYSTMVAELIFLEDQANHFAINTCISTLETHPDFERVIDGVSEAMSNVETEEDLTIASYGKRYLSVSDQLDLSSELATMLLLVGFDLDKMMGEEIRRSNYQLPPDELVALRLTVINNDRISIDGKEIISEEDFKKVIKVFCEENAVSAAFTVVNPEQTTQETFDYIKNIITQQINELRREMSEVILNTEYTELTDEGRKYIHGLLPINFIGDWGQD